jgi:hypothetical protein
MTNNKGIEERIKEDYVKEMLTHFVTFKGECYHEENEDKERFLNEPIVKSAVQGYTKGLMDLLLQAQQEERKRCVRLFRKFMFTGGSPDRESLEIFLAKLSEGEK